MSTPHRIPAYWPAAVDALSQRDAVMAGLIRRYHGEGLTSHGEAFHTLARSIVGQQISVKAADAVWGKLESGIRSRESGIVPRTLLEMSDDALRACGLSRQKVTYLKAIAAHFEAKGIGPGYFDAMEDAEIISELVAIKGVGQWTAEMFLIFHLMRPDVFPVDDIGVQKAVEQHYGAATPSLTLPLKGEGSARGHYVSAHANVDGDKNTSPIGRGRNPRQGISGEGRVTTKKAYYAALTAHAEQWRPYRTVATWYLWRALDPVVVAY